MRLSKIKPKNRKGALELSIGTLVIIVIGMAMLILGLVLVRNIFGIGTGVVDLVDQAAKDELNKLFNDPNTRSVVYLSGGVAEIKPGNSYNLEFGIKNVLSGSEGVGAKFAYTVFASEVEEGCGITETDADGIITIGKSGSGLTIPPGADPSPQTVRLKAGEGFPLCSMKFNIDVTFNDNLPYHTNSFIVEVIS